MMRYFNEEKTFSSFLLGMQPKCSYGNSHHGLNILIVNPSVSPSNLRYTWCYHHFLSKRQLAIAKRQITLKNWTKKGVRIMDLVKEGRIIQERIRSSCQRVSKDYAKIFSNLMMHGRVQPWKFWLLIHL